jgi:sensor histidine kinase YesM
MHWLPHQPELAAAFGMQSLLDKRQDTLNHKQTTTTTTTTTMTATMTMTMMKRLQQAQLQAQLQNRQFQV